MKPWLFDILACPIDKYFPLRLYIFEYETNLNQFESFLKIYNERDINKINKQECVEIINTSNGILVKDGIVIKKTPLKEYITYIIKSINELDYVKDKSIFPASSKCFELLTTVIKEKIINFFENIAISNINEILPELYLLNKIKLDTEIDSGLLFCEECNRWFPIIDTIPQMLPDEYRNKENDLDFLKKHKNLFNPKFFQQNLKPFNL